MLSIGIDPDTHGGISLLYGEVLVGFISIEFTPDWDLRLFEWCRDLNLRVASIEKQVSRPYQNVRGAQKYMTVYGMAQAAVRCAGQHLVFVESTAWQQAVGVAGLNRLEHDPKKRRTKNIATYKKTVQESQPFVKDWDKETMGDIYAATLIGIGGLRLQTGGK